MKKVFFTLLLFSSVILLSNCGGSSENKENGTQDEVSVVESTHETVEINGVKHHFEKMGSGDPIVVLHGGPGLFHDYLVPHFYTLAKSHQIIFYDQRGCGKTEFPNDTLSINIDTYVEDLEAIRGYLKIEKLNLLGHSWGALLALKYAKKYSANLNNLILVSPAPGNSDYFDQTFSNMQKKRSEEDTKELVQTMMSKEFEEREENTFRKAITLGDKVNLVNQKDISKLYEPMKFNKTNASNLMVVNSLLEKTYFNFDISEGLDQIQVPTLIIYGDLDNVPFASTQLIHDNMSLSKLEVIKKSCHYPFFETPKEFNLSVKNFLNPEYEQ